MLTPQNMMHHVVHQNATAPVRHRIMTRSRSKELPQPISNFGQASQEAVKNSPQAQTATKHSPETPIAVDGAEDVIDVAATVDSAGADTQAVTPDTIAAPKSPASGQTNIPQGIRPYDESAPILADGYGHDIHEFYFKREVRQLLKSSMLCGYCRTGRNF